MMTINPSSCGPTPFPNLCACGHLNQDHGPQQPNAYGAIYARKPKGRNYTFLFGGGITLSEARAAIRWDLNDGKFLYFWHDEYPHHDDVRYLYQLERPTFMGPLKAQVK